MSNQRPEKKKMMRTPRSKVCFFCKDGIDYVDYKDINKLRKLVNDRGKILPRRATGNCALHQRMVTVSIKRAREIALLPFVSERA
ncbi:MAG: 30S ribosomal protein S18 [Candidatus Wallbacteria bacterium]